MGPNPPRLVSLEEATLRTQEGPGSMHTEKRSPSAGKDGSFGRHQPGHHLTRASSL